MTALATADRPVAVSSALADLRDSTPGVLGVLVASLDGLPIAADIGGGDEAGVAAMASAAAGLGRRLVEEFSFGAFAENVVRGSDGYFVVYGIADVAVLAVTAADGVNIARVHLNARRCAAAVAAELVPHP